MIRVKICGITRPEDAAAAAEAGAWAIGLIFSRQSPRFITARQALAVIDALPKTVLRVGVFMDQSLEVIRRVEAEVPLDLIQLHGREPKELCSEIGQNRCIRAIVLNNVNSVQGALDFPSDFILVDRPREAPAGAGSVQKIGEKERWELAGQLARKRDKLLLAGGLTPGNVADAIRMVRPWGVDVSSGLESAPGIKDHELMRSFMQAVLSAEGAAS